MPQCTSCGTELSGRFCAICGNPAPTAESPQDIPTYTQGPPPPPAPPAVQVGTTDMPENLVCTLCYAMGALSGVLFLVLEPYCKNRTVRFHAFQSIFVSIAVFVLWFALLIFSGVMSFVPFVGLALGSALLGLFALAWLALWIILMMKAYHGELWKVPFIGDLAEKQAYTS